MKKFLRQLRMRGEAGQTIIEVLVAIALSAIMLPALATAIAAAREGRAQEVERLRASAYLKEGEEAIRSVREKGWSNIAALTVGSPYRPAIDNGTNTWQLLAGEETIDATNQLKRRIEVANVQRNASGAIVTSGGTVDPATKKVTLTVSWQQPLVSSLVTEIYIHRYLGNTTTIDTNQADFNGAAPSLGVYTNTASTATGEVQLAGGAVTVDWTTPAPPTPASAGNPYDAPGNDDATDLFVVGNYIYMADATTLSVLEISALDGTVTLRDSITAAGTINDIYVSGGYAYLATADNAGEITIINVADPLNITLAGTEDIASNTDASSIFVDSSGFIYVGKISGGGASREFSIFTTAAPSSATNPAPITGGATGAIEIAGDVTGVVVTGNYALLSTTINNQELLVVNVTSKATPVVMSAPNAYDASSSSDGLSIGFDGTYAYLTTASNTAVGGAEFFRLTVNNLPAAPTFTLAGSFDAGANVSNSAISGTLAFLATANASRQFTVVDMSTGPYSLKGGRNMTGTINDVVVVGNYAYAASTVNNSELTVLTGTASGGGGFQTSGTYVSPTIDFGATVGINRLAYTLTEPIAGTTYVRFQIAVNNDNATWNYVGPDGTAATFYQTTTYPGGGSVPLVAASGRYMRYQATLAGTAASTPAINDVTINYSP